MTQKLNFQQIGRFALTGAANTAVDILILNLLIYVFGVGENNYNYTVFKSISFIAAIINSYYLNKFWVFKDKDKNTSKEKVGFIVVSLIGFVINVAISSAVFSFLVFTNFPIFILATTSTLCGTVASMVWNFIGYKKFVFKA